MGGTCGRQRCAREIQRLEQSAQRMLRQMDSRREIFRFRQWARRQQRHLDIRGETGLVDKEFERAGATNQRTLTVFESAAQQRRDKAVCDGRAAASRTSEIRCTEWRVHSVSGRYLRR